MRKRIYDDLLARIEHHNMASNQDAAIPVDLLMDIQRAGVPVVTFMTGPQAHKRVSDHAERRMLHPHSRS